MNMLNTLKGSYFEEVFPKGLVYEGRFLRVGSPRCDALYGDRSRYREQFRTRHGLAFEAKVVMFAPTFREGSINGKRTVFSEVWSLDFKRLLDNLEKRFGGDWYLCLRVHPQLAAEMEEYQDEKLQGRLIDASREDDMYEILAAMDAFVTDYSSAAMDASYTHMPVFIYADDIERYVGDRGEMAWNLSMKSQEPVTNNQTMTPGIDVVLPYPVAQNNDEMEENIMGFRVDQYLSMMKQLESGVGLVFDGKASARMADILERYMCGGV